MENRSLNIEKINGDVFYSAFGKNSRIELKNKAFVLNKLAIGLQKFDNNFKQIAYLTFYLDLPAALNLCRQIIDGQLNEAAKTLAQKAGKDQIVTVYKAPGGMSAKKANRPDGKPLYREFSISKGKKWMVKISVGPGKTTETGGIVPDGKTETAVSIGMDFKTLAEMALMIKAEYQAYRTAQYILTANSTLAQNTNGDTPKETTEELVDEFANAFE